MVFDNMPDNPFGDMEVSDDVDVETSNEMLGVIIADSNGVVFKSDQGPSFPVTFDDIAVSVVVEDGKAQVSTLIIDDVGAAAAQDQAIQDVAVSLVDDHMRALAEWLVRNMPKEIENMSPGETMLELVIRLLGATLPPVDGRGFNKNTGKILDARHAKRRKLTGK